ncbi:MAG: methylmalonyl-CoA carboxyltransferase, partial [Bacteroidia bacterium]
MSIKQKSLDLRARMKNALSGGGSKAIEKQKAVGKLTARERIIAILDPKSFHEYDLFVEHAAKDFDMD